ncbi:MAG: hypothetical protein WCC45_10570, partial [Paeniglutamicibacter sp.]
MEPGTKVSDMALLGMPENESGRRSRKNHGINGLLEVDEKSRLGTPFMSILKSVVVVTSAALIASGALTASSAPAPAAGRTTQLHAAAPEQLNPGLLAAITKS